MEEHRNGQEEHPGKQEAGPTDNGCPPRRDGNGIPTGDVPRILRFLRLNPWSTKEEISLGTDVSAFVLRRLMEEKLNLRAEKRKAPAGVHKKNNQTRLRYALPVVAESIPNHKDALI